MPVLKKACCCVELATGAAIVGWLGAVGSVLNMLKFIIPQDQQQLEISTGSIVFTMIIYFLTLVISIMLIRGASAKETQLILPWLVVTIVEVIIGNIIMIILIFDTGIFELISLLIIGDLLGGYLWVCVYSFYQELKANPGGVV